MIVSYVDLFIISVMLFSIGMGFYRGFIWEILKYLAFGAAGFITFFASKSFYPHINHLEHDIWWMIGLCAIVFIASSSIFLYMIHLLSNVIKKTAFSLFNKILGAVFGGMRGSLFIILLYSGLMIITQNKKPDWINDTRCMSVLDFGNVQVQKILQSFGNEKFNKILQLKLMDKIENILTKDALI